MLFIWFIVKLHQKFLVIPDNCTVQHGKKTTTFQHFKVIYHQVYA